MSGRTLSAKKGPQLDRAQVIQTLVEMAKQRNGVLPKMALVSLADWDSLRRQVRRSGLAERPNNNGRVKMPSLLIGMVPIHALHHLESGVVLCVNDYRPWVFPVKKEP